MPSDIPPPASPPAKPAKPFPDFPLFWHHKGYWCKKIDGRQVGFGSDWQEAYRRYLALVDARRRGEQIETGRRRSPTVRDAVNLFLTRQLARMEDGKIGRVQFVKYRTELLQRLTLPLSTRLDEIADSPDHLAAARQKAMARGPEAARRHLIFLSAMFDYAQRKGLMGALRFAEMLELPSHPASETPDQRAWSEQELRIILKASRRARSRYLYLCVLLGLNCAMGAADLAAMPLSAVNLDERLIRFPRVKRVKGRARGRERLMPMWQRTVDAFREYLAHRPAPAHRDYAHLAILNRDGLPLVSTIESRDENGPTRLVRVDSINLALRRLLSPPVANRPKGKRKRPATPPWKKLGLRRPGAGFYTLRAMFRTLTVGCDRDLVSVIMGHRFSRQIDEYYLRGDLRRELFKVAATAEARLFSRTKPRGRKSEPAAPPQAGKPARRRKKKPPEGLPVEGPP